MELRKSVKKLRISESRSQSPIIQLHCKPCECFTMCYPVKCFASILLSFHLSMKMNFLNTSWLLGPSECELNVVQIETWSEVVWNVDAVWQRLWFKLATYVTAEMVMICNVVWCNKYIHISIDISKTWGQHVRRLRLPAKYWMLWLRKPVENSRFQTRDPKISLCNHATSLANTLLYVIQLNPSLPFHFISFHFNYWKRWNSWTRGDRWWHQNTNWMGSKSKHDLKSSEI